MTVKTIPSKSRCQCNKGSVDQTYNIRKVIHPVSCKNEDCKCEQLSPVPNPHMKMNRFQLTEDLLTGLRPEGIDQTA